MSESERTPGYRNRSQVPPIEPRASRIAYDLPGRSVSRWQPAPTPERPAPTIRTSRCSFAMQSHEYHECAAGAPVSSRPMPPAALPRAPFEITPEQDEIRRLCRDFAANEIRPVSLAVDEADTEVPIGVWHRAAEIGLTSFMLPEWLWGGGMTDCLTGCIVQEELSHGCAGIGNLITSNGFF